jgi:hypothetical protein
MPDKTKPEARTAVGERRSSPRYRTRALTDGSVVATESGAKGGPSFLGTTVNVSSGGALVRTYEALTAGQQLTLTLHLPEGDLVVSGAVLHVEQDAVGCRLAGVRFTPLEGDAAVLLQKHLKGFDPLANFGSASAKKDAAAKDKDAGKDAGREKGASAVNPAPAKDGPVPVFPPSNEPSPLRKSLRSVREQSTVVFPFEGQIRR